MAKIKVENDAELPAEVLASEIQALSEGIRKLRTGRLNDKALFLLIQHAAPTFVGGSRVPIGTIKMIFDGIEELERTYLRKR